MRGRSVVRNRRAQGSPAQDGLAQELKGFLVEIQRLEPSKTHHIEDRTVFVGAMLRGIFSAHPGQPHRRLQFERFGQNLLERLAITGVLEQTPDFPRFDS